MNLYLKPGAVLNEAELSEQLGMSRTPIREALILLKNEGLVDIMPQRGSRVSHISLSLVREGYFMRRILETAIIQEIAGTLSSGQTKAMKNNLELQRQELARNVNELSDDFLTWMTTCTACFMSSATATIYGPRSTGSIPTMTGCVTWTPRSTA